MGLAIFSGKAHFQAPQHVGGPLVEPETRERFHRLCDDVFDRNYLTNCGPLCERLEAEVAARHRVADAVFMTNATIAQMVLMKAMGLSAGEAAVPANTFVSTAHNCEWLGMKPVFCDLVPDTLNLDPADFERRITPATRVVIPTHIFGILADMPAIVETATRHGVKVIADAAHAFDCDRGGVAPGGYGVPEFVSFHATKFFSTVEGGAVLTADAALAREMRDIRNFGFDRPQLAGKLGTNAKASEMAAAFGLASLPALGERRERLKEVRDAYIRELSGVPGVRIHRLDNAGRNNYRYFAFFVDREFGVPRDAVFEILRRENILVRLYFYPGCHRMPHYLNAGDGLPPALPQTDRALGDILSLPTSFVGVKPIPAVEAIASIIKTIHERRDDVNRWWRAAIRYSKS